MCNILLLLLYRLSLSHFLLRIPFKHNALYSSYYISFNPRPMIHYIYKHTHTQRHYVSRTLCLLSLKIYSFVASSISFSVRRWQFLGIKTVMYTRIRYQLHAHDENEDFEKNMKLIAALPSDGFFFEAYTPLNENSVDFRWRLWALTCVERWGNWRIDIPIQCFHLQKNEWLMETVVAVTKQ